MVRRDAVEPVVVVGYVVVLHAAVECADPQRAVVVAEHGDDRADVDLFVLFVVAQDEASRMEVEHLESAVGADIVESVFGLYDGSYIVVYQRCFVAAAMLVPTRAPHGVDAAQSCVPRRDPKIPFGVGLQRVDGSHLLPVHDPPILDAEHPEFGGSENQSVVRNDQVVDMARMFFEAVE